MNTRLSRVFSNLQRSNIFPKGSISVRLKSATHREIREKLFQNKSLKLDNIPSWIENMCIFFTSGQNQEF